MFIWVKYVGDWKLRLIRQLVTDELIDKNKNKLRLHGALCTN